MEGGLREALLVGAGVEEAGEGLGQRPGEAQPPPADALAAPALFGRDAGDDLHDHEEVVVEPLDWRVAVV